MTESVERFVLDSYALLAHLEDEAGAERVRAVLTAVVRGRARAYLSIINLGEVAYITERERGLVEAQHALNAIEQLPVELLDVTRERVFAAAHIKASHPISYADAFVIAAALELGATILTGDPEYAAVRKLATIEWLAR